MAAAVGATVGLKSVQVACTDSSVKYVNSESTHVSVPHSQALSSTIRHSTSQIDSLISESTLFQLQPPTQRVLTSASISGSVSGSISGSMSTTPLITPLLSPTTCPPLLSLHMPSTMTPSNIHSHYALSPRTPRTFSPSTTPHIATASASTTTLNSTLNSLVNSALNSTSPTRQSSLTHLLLTPHDSEMITPTPKIALLPPLTTPPSSPRRDRGTVTPISPSPSSLPSSNKISVTIPSIVPVPNLVQNLVPVLSVVQNLVLVPVPNLVPVPIQKSMSIQI